MYLCMRCNEIFENKKWYWYAVAPSFNHYGCPNPNCKSSDVVDIKFVPSIIERLENKIKKYKEILSISKHCLKNDKYLLECLEYRKEDISDKLDTCVYKLNILKGIKR